MSDLDNKIEVIKKHISTYPNFPKPGILFRDMFPIFRNPEILLILTEVLVAFSKKISRKINCIAGLDARGFLLGPIVSLELKVPFVPIRKKGKLPGTVIQEEYTLEYGTNTLEVQKSSIDKGQNVLIVDDLLATGGSLGAACTLIEKAGGNVIGCLVLMELVELGGRDKVPADLFTVLKF